MKTEISLFETELTANIRNYITSAIADGTTAMSMDNLIQCVGSPGRHVEGAPQGTNAVYYFKAMFRRVCEGNKDIATFIL